MISKPTLSSRVAACVLFLTLAASVVVAQERVLARPPVKISVDPSTPFYTGDVSLRLLSLSITKSEQRVYDNTIAIVNGKLTFKPVMATPNEGQVFAIVDMSVTVGGQDVAFSNQDHAFAYAGAASEVSHAMYIEVGASEVCPSFVHAMLVATPLAAGTTHALRFLLIVPEGKYEKLLFTFRDALFELPPPEGKGSAAVPTGEYAVEGFRFRVESATVDTTYKGMGPYNPKKDPSLDKVLAIRLILIEGDFDAFTDLAYSILYPDGKSNEKADSAGLSKGKEYTLLFNVPSGVADIRLSIGGLVLDLAPFLKKP